MRNVAVLEKKKSFKIENFGCQMNVADATEMKNLLLGHGYKEAEDDLPDLIILNSCAVRETAEERIYSRLKHYSTLKAKKQFILVLMGCVAQKEKENILKKAPYVDLIVGTHQKNQLPRLLKEHTAEQTNKVVSQFGDYQFMSSVPSYKYPFKADMTIIHGCDKFCTYCIVPYTRGREISRKSSDIILNTNQLVQQGVTEVQLLGQNVNSYGQDNDDISFAELLFELNKINGLKRIRFMTSHPKDFTSDLINVIRDCEKVCKYIHLPLQSASNNVLAKMKREYTYEHYYNIVSEIRQKMDNVVLSTDILVGFPYETEQDFEDTLNAIKEIAFDQAFMFKYSIRQGTEAAQYPDNVPENEKKKRLSLIIETQLKLAKLQNEKDIGKTEEVLFESISKNNPDELLGKTNGNKPVVLQLNNREIGSYKTVYLKELQGNTFRGEMVE